MADHCRCCGRPRYIMSYRHSRPMFGPFSYTVLLACLFLAAVGALVIFR